MYVVCKMIQRRIFLWFIVELLHTSFTRKAQIPLEFILFRTYFDYIFNFQSSSIFNVFHFYICVPSFLFLFCRGLLFFFFHCEVFHSIKTYFIMFFFPFCITPFYDLSCFQTFLDRDLDMVRSHDCLDLCSDLFAIWLCINCYQ